MGSPIIQKLDHLPRTRELGRGFRFGENGEPGNLPRKKVSGLISLLFLVSRLLVDRCNLFQSSSPIFIHQPPSLLSLPFTKRLSFFVCTRPKLSLSHFWNALNRVRAELKDLPFHHWRTTSLVKGKEEWRNNGKSESFPASLARCL